MPPLLCGWKHKLINKDKTTRPHVTGRTHGRNRQESPLPPLSSIRKTVWLIRTEVGAGTAENSSSRAIPRLSGRDSGSVPGARTLTRPGPAGSSTRCDRCLTDQIVSNFLLAALTASRRISSLSSLLSTGSPRPPPGTTGRFLEDLWKCWRSGKTTAFKSFITAGLTSLFGFGGRQLKGSAGRGKKKCGCEGFWC